MFFIIISTVHVSGGFSTHHQELIKLYVQPWLLSRFPAVYRWCGWVGTARSSSWWPLGAQFERELCTDRPPRTLVESDSTIYCMYTVYPPEDEHLRLETCRGT